MKNVLSKIWKVAKIVLQWHAVAFFVLFAIVEINVSSIFFLTAAFLCLPIKKIRAFLLNKMKIRGWVACLISIPFFFTGIATFPGDNAESDVDNNTSQTQSSSILESDEAESASSNEEESEKEESSSSEKEENSKEESTSSSKEESSKEESSSSEKEENSKEESSSSEKEEVDKVENSSSNKGESSSSEKEESSSKEEVIAPTTTYILNTSTKTIHLSSCRHVSTIKPANKETATKTLAELQNQGYKVCKTCLG